MNTDGLLWRLNSDGDTFRFVGMFEMNSKPHFKWDARFVGGLSVFFPPLSATGFNYPKAIEHGALTAGCVEHGYTRHE